MYATFAVLLTCTAGMAGYVWSRNFVRRRLRFVDAIRSPWVPFAAGAVATVVAAPLTLLPLVSMTTAVCFGIGTAFGTASGVRAIRRAEWSSRLLLP
ncbi:MAG TPA: hypothetical protein VFS33_05975 [Gemmatimonadales bacterium]|nr:hypothetical protein [Gemmatimonadales bacterium]